MDEDHRESFGRWLLQSFRQTGGDLRFETVDLGEEKNSVVGEGEFAGETRSPPAEDAVVAGGKVRPSEIQALQFRWGSRESAEGCLECLSQNCDLSRIRAGTLLDRIDIHVESPPSNTRTSPATAPASWHGSQSVAVA